MLPGDVLPGDALTGCSRRGLKQSCLGFFNHIIHYLFQVSRRGEDAQLAVGAVAFFEDPPNVTDLFDAIELFGRRS